MAGRNPDDIAREWLRNFSDALSAGDLDSATSLFDDECYWRDLLTFTWNVKTLEGRSEIALMLAGTLAAVRPGRWKLDGEASGDESQCEAWFTFDTLVARGRGLFRLRNGRCWTILTAMTELKGHEEKRGPNRETGTQHLAQMNRKSWLERKTQEERELGDTKQPYCLIIGGGQGGIALGARMRRLGVPAIIVEKNSRAGDSWRNRYKSLVLHDPVWYDHLPYLPFPDDWPVFTPKDKMGDWLESYVRIMELNYWSSATCLGASFDSASKHWTVNVERDGRTIELRPKQLVFATGAYGRPKFAVIKGAGKFAGETLHTSTYASGENFRGKKCVVIGSASSAHDLCVDLWENGADVTMIQRSPSIVVRSETLMNLGFKELYSEEALRQGITTERADLITASYPYRVLPALQKPVYEEIARTDAEFYDGLTSAGFLWDFGDDNSGLMMKAMRTASGYYIDVGASKLIMDGEIKLKSGEAIAEISQKAVHLGDGSKIPADVIIHATGFHSVDDTIAQLISPKVAETVGKFWGYGSGVENDPGPWEGELRNMWKPTAQEGLWFHGGNLALSRHYSLYVSLQIKARMEGIPTPVYT